MKGTTPKLPREMTERGRPVDGGYVNAGDIFLTSTGRCTTPYPKAKRAVYSAQWLMDNVEMEYKARSDGWAETLFKGEVVKNLPPASVESMLLYLFGKS